MKKRALPLLSLLCVVFIFAISGCGGKAQVTGKVTFADGSPLTCGVVNFVDGDVLCKGEIDKKDGTFRMRTRKPGDGVPPGTYKVYITETLAFNDSGRAAQTGEVQTNIIGKATNLVLPKYSNQDESGLTVTVKGSMKYDIVLEGDVPQTESAE